MSKLLAPYTIRTETSHGYRTSDSLTEDEATQQTKDTIAKYKGLGYSQVKEGAYLFNHPNHRLTCGIKVFNAHGKLVTHELLTK